MRSDAIRLPYSDEQVEWAKRRLDVIRAGRGGGFYNGPAPWAGFLFEGLVHNWLSRLGIPHRWNGGNDGKPDIEVGELGFSVKCRAVDLERVRDPIVTIPVHQELPETIIVGIVDLASPNAWILGRISRVDLLSTKIVREGEELWHGQAASTDLYVMRPDDLQGIAEWLR